jgi:pyruvate, orthophosphate dikinase
MHSAVGILTARGGMTSHAAVVARGWGKCCVSGCSNIEVNESRKVTSYIIDKLVKDLLHVQIIQYNNIHL